MAQYICTRKQKKQEANVAVSLPLKFSVNGVVWPAQLYSELSEVLQCFWLVLVSSSHKPNLFMMS